MRRVGTLLERIRDSFDHNPQYGFYLGTFLTNLSAVYYSCVFSFFLASKAPVLAKFIFFLPLAVFWTGAIFGFPIGVLADKFGRIKVLSYGILISGIGCLILAYADSYPLYFLGAFLVGIGEPPSFITLTSWLMDNLPDRSRIKSFKYVGMAHLFAALTYAVACFMLVYFISGKYTTILFIIAAISRVLIAFLFRTLLRDNRGHINSSLINIGYRAIRHFFKTKELIKISVMLFGFFNIHMVFENVMYSWTKSGNLFTLHQGVFYLIMGISGLYLGWTVTNKNRHLKTKGLEIVWLLMGIGITLIFVFDQKISFYLGFGAFCFGYGGFMTIYRAWSHTYIPSSIRTAVSSLLYAIAYIGYRLGRYVIEYFDERYGMVTYQVLLGIILLMALLLVFTWKEQKYLDIPKELSGN